mmetsp:Transcript_28701/g.34966  ORF Transcript_28701/g.34966 Transcript_28701/m.34966 type:complete len:239 (-) Transcript_28701:28-744(-)|eukprot:CAMPEP_0172497844 /NCGR_PEP_ID=MMETSP1066-20121228/106055_1 /TAXON_ID=671091 /ORGANISM="Coscinodiscus wailesii, Strain CCMP2513" /LENGTH=238 /DNA_ID=CAMNT_0013270849 /DNA_START=44 /DNA_END=760 /DNA_ORIENTATION=+
MSYKVCPIPLFMFAASAAAYTVTIKKNNGKTKGDTSTKGGTPKYQVVFVLGGPGAGKGTQCERLSKDLNWSHLSAGDLLRAERQKSDSELGQLINARIKSGQLVPSEITVRLLQNAMDDIYATDPSKTKFLIDGFPRSEENYTAWEDAMVTTNKATVEFVLFLDCPEDVMTSRLTERGKTSGRNDDTLDVIRKRFETFRKESMPIVDMYEKENKVRKISADRSVDAVYKEVSGLFVNL